MVWWQFLRACIRSWVRRVLFCALPTALLAACGPSTPPVEQGARHVVQPDRVPVVLVPGISREVGAELRGGRFMPFSGLALRTDAETVAHLGDPRFAADSRNALTLPSRLDQDLRRVEVRGLQGLIDRLVAEAGYMRGNPEQPLDKDYPENSDSVRTDRTRLASLYVFYYDWRRDLVENACLVAHRVARIRALTGAPRVHLVGHSLGGVVVRYYARYGGRDVVRDRDCPLTTDVSTAMVNAPGSANIGRLVSLGTPYQGSALAFRALLEDFSLFGVMGVGLRAAVFTMPVAWEMLPFAEADGRVPLLLGTQGDGRVRLYAAQTWVERGWLVGDPEDPARLQFVEALLARAKALQQHLQERSAAEDGIPRLLLGGGCRPTLARALVENGKLEFLSRFQTDNPWFDRATVPGDGVVSLASALGVPSAPTLSSLTVCTSHNGYVDNSTVTERIVQFLGH